MNELELPENTSSVLDIQKVFMIALPNANGADELICPFCLKTTKVMGYAMHENWYPGHSLIHSSDCPVPLSFK